MWQNSKSIGMASLAVLILLTLRSPACQAQQQRANQRLDPTLSGTWPAQLARNDVLGDPMPEGALLRLGTVRFRHPSNVVDIALSPDEQTIISIGRELIAWDAESGKEKWRANAEAHGIELPGAAYGIRPLSFSPDGQFLWTPGRGGQINQWNVATGKPTTIAVRRVPADAQRESAPRMLENIHPANLTSRSIDASSDGKLLAVGSSKGVVVASTDGDIRFEIPNQPKVPVAIEDANSDRLLFGGDYSSGQFSPDGSLVAVVRSESPQEILLVDSRDGNEVRRIPLKAKLVRLAFSSDGKSIAATERDRSVQLYDVASGEKTWSQTVKLTNQFENYTSAIAFSPDGKLVAVAATDNLLYLFDAASGTPAGQMKGHTWYPWALAFSKDGGTLYSSGWDGPIRRWDMHERKQLPLPEGVRASGLVTVSPSQTTLAYCDDAGTLRLVDAESGAEEQTLAEPGALFSQAAFSPDGAQLAAGGTSGASVIVVVWDLATGKATHQWSWPKGRDSHSSVEAIAFSPDGTRLAAAVFRQSQAMLWDLASGVVKARLQHPEIYGLAFSPDGALLTTVGWDSKLRTWNPRSGTLNETIDVAKRADDKGDFRMYAVSYSPIGDAMATAHMDNEVWIWNTADMTRRKRFGLRGNFSYGALAFSPDGLWVATGLSSGRVSLWDAFSGEEVWNRSHQDHVYNIAFRRGSSQVVSGADDGVCYLWQVNSQAPPVAGADVERLWQDLAGDSGKDAYRAMTHLAAAPAVSVPFVIEKIRDVESLLDPQEAVESDTAQESLRARRLKGLLIEKDPRIERRITYRRAVALLAQIGTPEALDALGMLASKKGAGEIAELAAAYLHAARTAKNSTAPASQP